MAGCQGPLASSSQTVRYSKIFETRPPHPTPRVGPLFVAPRVSARFGGDRFSVFVSRFFGAAWYFVPPLVVICLDPWFLRRNSLLAKMFRFDFFVSTPKHFFLSCAVVWAGSRVLVLLLLLLPPPLAPLFCSLYLIHYPRTAHRLAMYC